MSGGMSFGTATQLITDRKPKFGDRELIYAIKVVERGKALIAAISGGLVAVRDCENCNGSGICEACRCCESHACGECNGTGNYGQIDANDVDDLTLAEIESYLREAVK